MMNKILILLIMVGGVMELRLQLQVSKSSEHVAKGGV